MYVPSVQVSIINKEDSTFSKRFRGLLREEKCQEKERVRARKKSRGRTNAAAGPSNGSSSPMPPT